MNLLNQNRNRLITGVTVGITLVYLITRLVNLTLLPVFSDEAIYVRWAQTMAYDKTKLLLPLFDGKTPLFIWLLIPCLGLWPQDPLFAARFLSAFSGIGLLWVILKITQLHYPKKNAAVDASIIFLVLPFSLFYQRMGLIDNLLTSFLGFSVWFFSKWRKSEYLSLDIIYSGIFWGLALLTKTSAFYYLAVPMAIFIIDNLKLRPKTWLKSAVMAITGVIIGLLFIAWMRSSPWFPFLFNRTSDFAFSLTEIVEKPFSILWFNIRRFSPWLWTYVTPPIILLLAGSGLILKKNKPVLGNVGYLILSALLFLFPFLITGKLMASRYLLPIIIWLIPAAGILFAELRAKNIKIYAVALALFTYSGLRFDVPLLYTPEKTPFPKADTIQYLTEWSAGYGIPETVSFIKQEAAKGKIVIATEGYFGTLPDGLLMYFDKSPLIKNLEIFGVGPAISGINDEIKQKMDAGETVYLLANQHRLNMNYEGCCTLVASYPRPLNGPALLLLKVNKYD